jgi:2-polyprenyl-6-methoxyphenol hydroxylase-like FAD-dependent oxidoreductase
VAAVADTAMSASLLQNPFRSPPRIEGIASRRVTFPLQLQQAKTYVSPRVALMGDAAHSIHPQAGQGLNLGIRDADALSEIVLKGIEGGQDIGSILLLKDYERKRYYSNLSMLGIVDVINTLFNIGATQVCTSTCYPFHHDIYLLRGDPNPARSVFTGHLKYTFRMRG